MSCVPPLPFSGHERERRKWRMRLEASEGGFSNPHIHTWPPERRRQGLFAGSGDQFRRHQASVSWGCPSQPPLFLPQPAVFGRVMGWEQVWGGYPRVFCARCRCPLISPAPTKGGGNRTHSRAPPSPHPLGKQLRGPICFTSPPTPPHFRCEETRELGLPELRGRDYGLSNHGSAMWPVKSSISKQAIC